ncbi:MAG: DUF3263 domain-containing protein [Salana multivorans]|nr:DUF3263 domain-containing protein [Salana multivorans]MBN8883010.1 DUF3263 domain-containing protein [Salana multivorans]
MRPPSRLRRASKHPHPLPTEAALAHDPVTVGRLRRLRDARRVRRSAPRG